MITRGAFRGKSLAKIQFSPMLTLFCIFLTITPCFLASCFLCMRFLPSLLRVNYAPAQFSPTSRTFTQSFTRSAAYCGMTRPSEEIPFLPCAQLPVAASRNPVTNFAPGIIGASAHLPPPNRAFSQFFRQPATHCGMSAPNKEIPCLPCAQLPDVMHRNPGRLSLITSGASWPQ